MFTAISWCNLRTCCENVWFVRLLAGIVYDITGNYDTAFHVGGALLFLTGLLFCLLHLPRFKPKSVAVPEIVVGGGGGGEPEESLLAASGPSQA